MQIKKWISGLLVFFFFTNSVFAQVPLAVSPATNILNLKSPAVDIQIPAELGTVEHRSPGAGPMVIHISDAHANYEAQLQIKNILDYLITKHSVRLVGLEGASSILRPEMFHLFPDKKVNSAVIDSLVKDGELTGPEFLAIENDSKSAPIWTGVEDKSLYLADLAAFRSVHEKYESQKNFFEKEKIEIAKLKTRVFSEELRKFDAAKNQFTRRRVNFIDYGRALQKAASRYLKLDLANPKEQKEFPNLVRIAILSSIETNVRKQADKIEKEKSALQSKLNGFGWTTQNPDRRFFEKLYGASRKNKVDLNQFPAFKQWAEYEILKSEIDAPSLFEEISKLEARLYDALIHTAKERALVHRSENLRLTEKFVRLEVTREEYLSFPGLTGESNQTKLDSRRSLPPSVLIGGGNDNIAELIREARQFYTLAIKRDASLITNLLKQAREKKLSNVVLVTGGFHTSGIEHILKSRQISHITVTPKITSEDKSGNYLRVILDKLSAPLVTGDGVNPARVQRVLSLAQLRGKRFGDAALTPQRAGANNEVMKGFFAKKGSGKSLGESGGKILFLNFFNYVRNTDACPEYIRLIFSTSEKPGLQFEIVNENPAFPEIEGPFLRVTTGFGVFADPIILAILRSKELGNPEFSGVKAALTFWLRVNAPELLAEATKASSLGRQSDINELCQAVAQLPADERNRLLQIEEDHDLVQALVEQPRLNRTEALHRKNVRPVLDAVRDALRFGKAFRASSLGELTQNVKVVVLDLSGTLLDETMGKAIEGVPAVIEKLKQRKDLHIVVFTNAGWKTIFRAQSKFPFLNGIEFVSTSEVRCPKPLPGAYSGLVRKLEEKYGVEFEPDEILCADDSEENLDVPRELGWLTVHVTRNQPLGDQSLIQDLAKDNEVPISSGASEIKSSASSLGKRAARKISPAQLAKIPFLVTNNDDGKVRKKGTFKDLLEKVGAGYAFKDRVSLPASWIRHFRRGEWPVAFLFVDRSAIFYKFVREMFYRDDPRLQDFAFLLQNGAVLPMIIRIGLIGICSDTPFLFTLQRGKKRTTGPGTRTKDQVTNSRREIRARASEYATPGIFRALDPPTFASSLGKRTKSTTGRKAILPQKTSAQHQIYAKQLGKIPVIASHDLKVLRRDGKLEDLLPREKRRAVLQYLKSWTGIFDVGEWPVAFIFVNVLAPIWDVYEKWYGHGALDESERFPSYDGAFLWADGSILKLGVIAFFDKELRRMVDRNSREKKITEGPGTRSNDQVKNTWPEIRARAREYVEAEFIIKPKSAPTQASSLGAAQQKLPAKLEKSITREQLAQVPMINHYVTAGAKILQEGTVGDRFKDLDSLLTLLEAGEQPAAMYFWEHLEDSRVGAVAPAPQKFYGFFLEDGSLLPLDPVLKLESGRSFFKLVRGIKRTEGPGTGKSKNLMARAREFFESAAASSLGEGNQQSLDFNLETVIDMSAERKAQLAFLANFGLHFLFKFYDKFYEKESAAFVLDYLRFLDKVKDAELMIKRTQLGNQTVVTFGELSAWDKRIAAMSYYVTGAVMSRDELIKRLDEKRENDFYALEQAGTVFTTIAVLTAKEGSFTFKELLTLYRRHSGEIKSVMGNLLHIEEDSVQKVDRSDGVHINTDLDLDLLKRALNIALGRVPLSKTSVSSPRILSIKMLKEFVSANFKPEEIEIEDVPWWVQAVLDEFWDKVNVNTWVKPGTIVIKLNSGVDPDAVVVKVARSKDVPETIRSRFREFGEQHGVDFSRKLEESDETSASSLGIANFSDFENSDLLLDAERDEIKMRDKLKPRMVALLKEVYESKTAEEKRAAQEAFVTVAEQLFQLIDLYPSEDWDRGLERLVGSDLLSYARLLRERWRWYWFPETGLDFRPVPEQSASSASSLGKRTKSWTERKVILPPPPRFSAERLGDLPVIATHDLKRLKEQGEFEDLLSMKNPGDRLKFLKFLTRNFYVGTWPVAFLWVAALWDMNKRIYRHGNVTETVLTPKYRKTFLLADGSLLKMRLVAVGKKISRTGVVAGPEKISETIYVDIIPEKITRGPGTLPRAQVQNTWLEIFVRAAEYAVFLAQHQDAPTHASSLGEADQSQAQENARILQALERRFEGKPLLRKLLDGIVRSKPYRGIERFTTECRAGIFQELKGDLLLSADNEGNPGFQFENARIVLPANSIVIKKPADGGKLVDNIFSFVSSALLPGVGTDISNPAAKAQVNLRQIHTGIKTSFEMLIDSKKENGRAGFFVLATDRELELLRDQGFKQSRTYGLSLGKSAQMDWPSAVKLLDEKIHLDVSSIPQALQATVLKMVNAYCDPSDTSRQSGPDFLGLTYALRLVLRELPFRHTAKGWLIEGDLLGVGAVKFSITPEEKNRIAQLIINISNIIPGLLDPKAQTQPSEGESLGKSAKPDFRKSRIAARLASRPLYYIGPVPWLSVQVDRLEKLRRADEDGASSNDVAYRWKRHNQYFAVPETRLHFARQLRPGEVPLAIFKISLSDDPKHPVFVLLKDSSFVPFHLIEFSNGGAVFLRGIKQTRGPGTSGRNIPARARELLNITLSVNSKQKPAFSKHMERSRRFAERKIYSSASSLGEESLNAEGRSLGDVLGTIQELAGRIVGRELPSVRDFLYDLVFGKELIAIASEDKSIQDFRAEHAKYVRALPGALYAKAHQQQPELGVLATTSDLYSPEIERQLMVNSKALAVIVFTGLLRDLNAFKQQFTRVSDRVIIEPASKPEAGSVMNQILSGSKLRKLAGNVKQTVLARHTAVFASSEILSELTALKLSSRLVASDKEGLIQKQLASFGISESDFKLYGNAVGFLIAKNGGYDALDDEAREGLTRPDGNNWIRFNLSLLGAKIAQLVNEFAGFQAVQQAA